MTVAVYASLLMPSDDTSLAGGGIDRTTRLAFETPLATPSALQVVSSDAADITQTVSVRARLQDGLEQSQIVVLDGTTPVELDLLGVVAYVLEARLSDVAEGTVTIEPLGGGADVAVVPIGEQGFRSPFIGCTSAPTPKTYYAKGFITSNSLASAVRLTTVSEAADPDTKFSFTLGAVVDDEVTLTNRLTAPDGGDLQEAFSSAAKSGPEIPAGSALAVWFAFAVVADEAEMDTSCDLTLVGVESL